MSNLSEIGVSLSTYLVSSSPQEKNNSLQWYLAGSLATIIMSKAESITEIELDESNNIKGEISSKEITHEQRKKMAKFTRKLGMDIDFVNVNGDLYNNAPLPSQLLMPKIIQNVPHVLDLMSWTASGGGGPLFYDNLEADRDISFHHVAKIKTPNGNVYVAAPPEQLAYKLSETMVICRGLVEKKQYETHKSPKYQKDIKDLASMFYGFKDLYSSDEFLDRIYNTLNQKVNSLFSIHNPIFAPNPMKAHEIIETQLMRRIAEDSINYLKDSTDDKSAMELNEFLNSLMIKRKLDVEKTCEIKSTNRLTPLQQREAELSSLEEEAKGYEEKLKDIQPKGRDIGEK